MEVELGTVVNTKTVVHRRSASRMSPEQAAVLMWSRGDPDKANLPEQEADPS